MGRVILLGGGWRGRTVGRMILLGSRSGMGAMHRVVLRVGGYRYQRGGDEEQRVHHASSVSGNGRTVTTFIITACRWKSNWTWKAQPPGSVAMCPKSALVP